MAKVLTPESIGLDAAQYAAALTYLFDRPMPESKGWYHDIGSEIPDFPATPLEWTRIQTILFANAGNDLARYDNDQVGFGLSCLMENTTKAPYAVLDASVPVEEAMVMMQAMPALWRECIGPRLASIHAPIGSNAGGHLGYVCYMWFDVWPTFWNVRHLDCWRDAMWHVFAEMLKVPCREVQIAALHGIGHNLDELQRPAVINQAIDAFLAHLNPVDIELREYAGRARQGYVQ